MTRKRRDPRAEKLRDFRRRGKHLHTGRKVCGVCSCFYRGFVRADRRVLRASLRDCSRREGGG